ncbi:EAL domain-containing protein [Shewanella psychrophila]|uniref:EAL domain-containing protein n=1 Tax=Shewanella psychrophila TaxID=225848 RepID=A0A1S6HU62_9GAMM|nr:EAL domain-containing protein [Shewanella psychrophila]AQS39107.1 EAL domain-containing protein [Shewanella psychrophila]
MQNILSYSGKLSLDSLFERFSKLNYTDFKKVFYSKEKVNIEESMILNGLSREAFVPFYQPIIDSHTGHVLGAEVLVRLVKDNGLIASPYEFINYAEKSGLIIEITEQFLSKTFDNFNQLGWSDSDKYLSINIVPEHLKSRRLFKFIQDYVERGVINGNQIKLEITERLEINDLPGARSYLEDFYQLGITASLDDAGTGYGCFLYLQELALSSLKLDKIFIDTITENKDTSVLDSIIGLAKSLKLDIVAEGVESLNQVTYLNRRGVKAIQGYVYGQPMPATEFIDWQSAK